MHRVTRGRVTLMAVFLLLAQAAYADIRLWFGVPHIPQQSEILRQLEAYMELIDADVLLIENGYLIARVEEWFGSLRELRRQNGYLQYMSRDFACPDDPRLCEEFPITVAIHSLDAARNPIRSFIEDNGGTVLNEQQFLFRVAPKLVKELDGILELDLRPSFHPEVEDQGQTGLLRLGEGHRFEVTANGLLPSGKRLFGRASELTRDSGTFSFFGSNNVEVSVKILDGCGVNGHMWLLAAGMTDLATSVMASDSKDGVVRQYDQPAGPFETIVDLEAFDCP